jgi:hypothetical protein
MLEWDCLPLQVLDVDWDATLGANTLDAILARHFTKVFADKHKLDVQSVLSNPKSMAKMKKQVRGRWGWRRGGGGGRAAAREDMLRCMASWE